MSCTWGKTDCKNQDTQCYMCFKEDQFYVSTTKVKMPKKAKETGRKGSKFEAVNSNNNNALLLGGSVPTPNSGAGKIKGDEHIRGLINTMEELKEQNATTARGAKTFTIHKEWLDKLKREAMVENKEFWYLKFAFSTQDALASIHYVIVDVEQFMGMIKTMWEDRKKAKLAQAQIDVANKRANLAEAENVKLRAEIELLKAELALATKGDDDL